MSIEKNGSGRGNPATWIDDGEKYALVGLSVKVEDDIPFQQFKSYLWASAETTFYIPAHWREWLGSIRTEEVDDCNLFLLSKLHSLRPEVLDDENKKLQQRVSYFYSGLLLASTFAPAHKPVMLTGSRRVGEIDIRQQQDFDSPIPCLFRPYPPVVSEDIRLAAQLGEKLGALAAAPPTGGPWRLFRTLHIYTESRTTADILDRLHQYSRCIDGLILPNAGETKRQFKSRTELFIGPRHHDLMGEIYEVRSAVEHLHENQYLESFDRETRLDLVKKEAIAEHIARSALARIVEDSNLWPHFANTSALGKFWALGAAERRQIWGEPIDPADALADFDPRYIHNGHLGAT
jgi:hypothetical protein